MVWLVMSSGTLRVSIAEFPIFSHVFGYGNHDTN